VVVIPTKYNDHDYWADCVDRFIWVVKQKKRMYNVPIGATVGPVHSVPENAALGGIDIIRRVNNHVD